MSGEDALGAGWPRVQVSWALPGTIDLGLPIITNPQTHLPETKVVLFIIRSWWQIAGSSICCEKAAATGWSEHQDHMKQFPELAKEKEKKHTHKYSMHQAPFPCNPH